ncbi:TPA: hypothetical protein ACQ298_000433 [Klebsiella pneumoniae]
MTNNQLNRERLEKIKSWRETYGAGSNVMLPAEEAEELARIALAAMDSEPVAWTDEQELRDVDRGGCGYLFTVNPVTPHADERRIILLYRHAQPAPEAMPECFRNAVSALESLYRNGQKQCWHERYTTDMAYASGVLNACRAAMLQVSPVCTCPSGDGSLRWPCPVHPGNSPVIPDGYVMVPMRLTAENGAKGALSGEFSESKFVNCPECFGDDECETCDGSGKIEITVPVTWTTIKAIWVKGVEHFAATAQENN